MTNHQQSAQIVLRKVGHYGWMKVILRWRARKHGGMFPIRMYRILKRFGRAARPYFLGRTSDGIKFVGDFRDIYPIVQMVDPAFQADFTRFLCELAKRHPNGSFVDVGANMGVIAATVAGALRGISGVVAIEPIPETAQRAEACFALNELSNVRLLRMAVTSEDSEVELWLPVGESDRASVERSAVGTGASTIQVKVVGRCLDSLRADGTIGKVSVVKFDVEGHEPAAIRGALKMIRQDRPHIIFEYSYDIAPSMGWTAEDIARLIRSAGDYEFYTLGSSATLETFPPPSGGSGALNIYSKPVNPT